MSSYHVTMIPQNVLFLLQTFSEPNESKGVVNNACSMLAYYNLLK